MAHFARIDDNGFVREVIVINNSELIDVDGKEKEHLGAKFCHDHFGGRWIQTSYNGNFRGRFAGVGFWYDRANDVFVEPTPKPIEEDTVISVLETDTIFYDSVDTVLGSDTIEA